VLQNLSKTYHYEGIAYSLNAAPNSGNDSPLYRFLNLKTGVYFYTASEAEEASILANLSNVFRLEGIAYKVSLTAKTGASPVYRFFNLHNGSHFYTISEAEKNNVIATLSSTYHFEGVGFYVVTSDAPGAVTNWPATLAHGRPGRRRAGPERGRSRHGADRHRGRPVARTGGHRPATDELQLQLQPPQHRRAQHIGPRAHARTGRAGRRRRGLLGRPRRQQAHHVQRLSRTGPGVRPPLHYTGDPDQTDTGGAPTTKAGYGPNTRTVMQFQVGGPVGQGLNLPGLEAALPAAFKRLPAGPNRAREGLRCGDGHLRPHPGQHADRHAGRYHDPRWPSRCSPRPSRNSSS